MSAHRYGGPVPMSYWVLFPYFTLVTLIGFWIGWASAHIMVASECDKLGVFCVDDKVYECRRKE